MKLVIDIGDSAADVPAELRSLRPGTTSLTDGDQWIGCRIVGALVEEAHDGYKPDGTYGHVHREVVKPLEDL